VRLRKRSPATIALLALASALAAAGCNFIVGVGDYGSGGTKGDDGSSAESGSSSGAGDDSAIGADGSGESGPDGEAGVDATAPVEAGLDAIADVAVDGPGSCSPTLIASCPTGSVGYLCTGSDRPQQEADASLACQLATAVGGVGTGGPTAYCCVTSSCAPLTGLDSGTYTGASCDDGWVPYGCSSTDTPQQGAVPLACVPASGGCFGSTDYCCTTPTCVAKSNLSCPAAGQKGYSCPGGDSPQNLDPTVQCNQVGTGNDYCCGPITCSMNPSLSSACAFNQTGYSCTGSDYPGNDFPSVSGCSGGSSGSEDGGSDYCCSPSCFTNNDCAWNSYGTVCSYGEGCVAPTGLVGDPCSTSASVWAPCSDADGGTATCNGAWCTQSCTTSDSCGTNSAGNSNICVTTVGLCFPSCYQSADCAPYGDSFCVPTGSGVSVCAARVGHVGGMIGDPCGADSDCTSDDGGANGTCDQNLNACTRPCASLSDTSCGANTLGIANYCGPVPFSTGYECVPGCATNDCSAYTQSSCGAPQSICTASPDNSFYYCVLAQ
jgi:hypothetical protein